MITTSNFQSIRLLRNWCMSTLPTVFNDALSYNEQVCKLTEALNQQGEIIKGLPEYIEQIVKELLEQAGLEDIVKQVLADYFFINVKNPPVPLAPAIGDGVADDTVAIQAMINYVAGKPNYLFFPAGTYSVQGLAMADGVSLIGLDRFKTIIMLRPASNKDLLTGDLGNCTISNIMLNANMPGQTANCSVYSGNVTDMIIGNVIFKNGYNMLSLDVDGTVQIDNVVFDGVQGNGLSLAGTKTMINNIEFVRNSALNAGTLLTISGGNNIVTSLLNTEFATNGIVINGNDNVLSGWVSGTSNAITDNGTNNQVSLYTGTEHIIQENKIIINSKTDITEKATDITLDPENPLTYKTPINYNNYFDSILMKDSNNTEYNVLVGKNETNSLGGVRYFNVRNDIAIDTTTQIGQVCYTLGFSTINDGGGARYRIRAINQNETPNGFTTFITNGLMAELIWEGFIWADQLGAIHNEPSIDCSLAINYALKNTTATVLFMSGVYYFSNAISNTTIRIINKPDTTLIYNGNNTINSFISMNEGSTTQIRDNIIAGGTVDCNLKCNNAITVNRIIQTPFQDFVIKNVLVSGISISASSQGNTFSNVRVTNGETQNAISGTTGILNLGGDNTFFRCVIVDCETGIQLNGADCAIECHPWISRDSMYTGSTAFKISGEGNMLTCCQSDTCEIGIKCTYTFAGFNCNNFRYFNATTGVTPAKIASGNQKFIVCSIQARGSFTGTRIQSNAGCVVTVVPDDVLARMNTNLNEYDGKLSFSQTQYTADNDIQTKIVNIPPEFTNQNPNLYALSKGSSGQVVTIVPVTGTSVVADYSQMHCEKSQRMCHLYGSFTLGSATAGTETVYLIQGAPIPVSPVYTWIMGLNAAARTYTAWAGILGSNGNIGSYNAVLNTGIRYYVDLYYFIKE